MFDELRKELAELFSSLQPGPATRTLTVAKPACTPARDIVTGALDGYGVRIYRYSERMRTTTPREYIRQLGLNANNIADRLEKPLPLATIVKVTVSEAQAAWAEYLLLRTGKLYVPGAYVNQRNADWAAKHGGRMPPAWEDSKPWIEASCSDGMAAWNPLRDAAAKRSKR